MLPRRYRDIHDTFFGSLPPLHAHSEVVEAGGDWKSWNLFRIDEEGVGIVGSVLDEVIEVA